MMLKQLLCWLRTGHTYKVIESGVYYDMLTCADCGHKWQRACDHGTWNQ